MPVLEFLPKLQPTRAIVHLERGDRDVLLARRDGRHQAHRAPHHRPGRRQLAPTGAPLVVAGRAEPVLQVIVSARQIWHLVAAEQAGPVTAGHPEELPGGHAEEAGRVAEGDQFDQEVPVGPSHGPDVVAVGVGQQVRRLVHPGIGAANIRPEGRGQLQAPGQQGLQARQLPREIPFSPTRAMEH